MRKFLACALALGLGLGLRAERPYDLYLLVGQSNMSGRGFLTEDNRIVDPRVFSFGREDRFVPAVEPLHWEKKSCGAGLGMSFAIDMAGKDPEARIGVEDYRFGQVVCSVLATRDEVSVRSNREFTLVFDGKRHEVVRGENNFKRN